MAEYLIFYCASVGQFCCLDSDSVGVLMWERLHFNPHFNTTLSEGTFNWLKKDPWSKMSLFLYLWMKLTRIKLTLYLWIIWPPFSLFGKRTLVLPLSSHTRVHYPNCLSWDHIGEHPEDVVVEWVKVSIDARMYPVKCGLILYEKNKNKKEYVDCRKAMWIHCEEKEECDPLVRGERDSLHFKLFFSWTHV